MTYSIVAFDAAAGQLGVGVQSRFFSVGAYVPFVESGVGAVATQASVEMAHGPNTLALLRSGTHPSEALTALLAEDDLAAVRQVGVVDASGNVAVHTGERTIADACHQTGEGYTIQANLMWRPTVCAAMAVAYEASRGDLAERILAALDAAEGEGGDVRGRQSAALVVVEGDRGTPRWEAAGFDVRVDDHPDPLAELRRLVSLSRAIRLVDEADDHFAKGEVYEAGRAYTAAQRLDPENHAWYFWHAVTLAEQGDLTAALPLFVRAFEMYPRWREVVPRLAAVGHIPGDDATLSQILGSL